MRTLQFFFLVSLGSLSSSTIGFCASPIDCADYCNKIDTCRKGCSWVNGAQDEDSCLKNNCYATAPKGCPPCPYEIKQREEEAKKQKENPQQYPQYPSY